MTLIDDEGDPIKAVAPDEVIKLDGAEASAQDEIPFDDEAKSAEAESSVSEQESAANGDDFDDDWDD